MTVPSRLADFLDASLPRHAWFIVLSLTSQQADIPLVHLIQQTRSQRSRAQQGEFHLVRGKLDPMLLQLVAHPDPTRQKGIAWKTFTHISSRL